MIEAFKHKSIDAADIHGTYLNIHTGEFLALKTMDEQMNMLYSIDSKCKEFSVIKNSKGLLHLMLNKVL